MRICAVLAVIGHSLGEKSYESFVYGKSEGPAAASM